jgi:hypothetical protein
MLCAVTRNIDTFNVHRVTMSDFAVRDRLSVSHRESLVQYLAHGGIAYDLDPGVVFEDDLQRLDVQMVGMFVTDDDAIDIGDSILRNGIIPRVSQESNPMCFYDQTTVSEFGDFHKLM